MLKLAAYTHRAGGLPGVTGGMSGDKRKVLHHQGPRGFCDPGRQNTDKGDPLDENFCGKWKPVATNQEHTMTYIEGWSPGQMFNYFWCLIDWGGNNRNGFCFFAGLAITFEPKAAYVVVAVLVLPSGVHDAEELHQDYNWNTNSHPSQTCCEYSIVWFHPAGLAV